MLPNLLSAGDAAHLDDGVDERLRKRLVGPRELPDQPLRLRVREEGLVRVEEALALDDVPVVRVVECRGRPVHRGTGILRPPLDRAPAPQGCCEPLVHRRVDVVGGVEVVQPVLEGGAVREPESVASCSRLEDRTSYMLPSYVTSGWETATHVMSMSMSRPANLCLCTCFWEEAFRIHFQKTTGQPTPRFSSLGFEVAVSVPKRATKSSMERPLREKLF